MVLCEVGLQSLEDGLDLPEKDRFLSENGSGFDSHFVANLKNWSKSLADTLFGLYPRRKP